MIYINGSYYPKDRVGRIREAKRNIQGQDVYGWDVYDREDNLLGFSDDFELSNKIDYEVMPNPEYFKVWCWDFAEGEIFFYEVPIIGWDVSEHACFPIGIDQPFAGIGDRCPHDYLVQDMRSGMCWIPYDRSFDDIHKAKKLIFEEEKANYERKKQAVSSG